jgi:site-specific DNA-methyltransferase (adenine-specific)
MDGMHSMSNVEIALTSFNKNAKHISINKDSRDRIHVTQKPVKLYEWVLQNYAEKENLILDTHVGSASSLIACENMKYKYVGCELDKDYYNKSLERLKFHIKSNNYDFVF